jgi:non-specific serine/threonine protein kinase
MVGSRLGQYVIEARLGAGGMGVVYRAFDSRLERRVAIKTIRDASGSAKARARLLREARSASGLNHPNICTVHEVGETDDMTYLVMEYVEGQPLKALIPPGGMPPEMVAAYGCQVASALAHAHARGVVHRDLKSANVVVTDGRAKVLDFGLAVRQVDSTADTTRIVDSLQRPGAVSGTLAYMSPEALRGAVPDVRGDIWALGVLLYELASARLPFDGQSAFDVSNRIFNDPPPPLSDQVPQLLRAVILRCLAKDPSRRYANAAEVVAALELLQTGASVTAPVAAAALMAAGSRGVLVLPFLNVAADHENDYFSDGLTDEIITDLSGVAQLRVISRTSSAQLKGTTRSLAELARDLKVDHVLEGSVRRAGNQLRITAKLVDPSTDSAIWAAKYQGTLEDIFEIQSTISHAIVDALRIRLTQEEEQRLAARPIADVRAYEWYLRARQELLRFTEDGLERALDCLEKATAIVGENVLLLAAEGATYWQYVNAGIRPDPGYLDKAEACALRILQIDAASPHGHRVRGLVRAQRGDIQGALRELNQALKADPNDADSLMWGSLVAGMTGKMPLAEAWAARLVEIDPVTPFYQLMPGSATWMRGDFEAARALYAAHDAAIRENPLLRLVYGQILVAAGRAAEGHRVLEDLARALPESPFGQLAAVYLHAFRGERDQVGTRLTPELLSLLERDPQYCWFLAQCHALVGDVDGGIRWVEAAVARGFINFPILAELDPFLASLRADARYATLMADVKARWTAVDL